MAAHRYRTSRAMHVVTHVQVRFQFPEVGQDLAIRPFVIAHSGPAIKVFGEPRRKIMWLMALEPPTTLPRGDGAVLCCW